jgi:beta-mannosidase
LTIEVVDFSGKKLLEVKESAAVSANSSVVYYEIHKSDLKRTSIEELMMVMSFKSANKEANSNYYFVKPKDLKLSKPTITITQINPTTIELTSDVLAKNVFLSAKDVFFSDNYFDVLPNQKVQITLSKPEQNIVIRSLFDTIN